MASSLRSVIGRVGLVWGNREKGWRVTFAFEETCDFVELVFWECGEDFGSGVHVSSKDGSLVFYDGEGEGVAVDV
jgi:hypothetical protein